MTTLICLPAHILDANISPRAREVLMLLASQTSAAEPALWICQATIAERLRCSVATVARAIQKLVEAKLIAETGKLHEGRYKFYHVRWSSDENLKAVSRKITKPVRKVVTTIAPVEPVAREISPPLKKGVGGFGFPAEDREPAPPVAPSTLSPHNMLTDNRIAYYAEVARKQYEENRKRYRAILLELR